MKRLARLPLLLVAFLSLGVGAVKAVETSPAEADALLLLRACATQLFRFQAATLGNVTARTCADPALQVFLLQAGLGDRRLDLSLTTEIEARAGGGFAVNVRDRTGRWSSFTNDLSSGGSPVIRFVAGGRAPFSPTSAADQGAWSWLHACDWAVRLYAGATFDTFALRLNSCSDPAIRRGALGSSSGLDPASLHLRSSITSREGEGYAISVQSESGAWFSLVYRFDDLELYNPPQLVPGKVTF